MASADIVHEYRRAMRRRALSPGTIEKRTSELRTWLVWCASASGVDWTVADDDDVERWLDDRPLGPRARSSAISHLHGFYGWARKRRLVDIDPTELVERPRLPANLPRPARRRAVDMAILEAPPIMRVMLTLMADAGLRCCEVARLEWRDVDLSDRVLLIHGKGNRDRLVGMPGRLARTLALLDDDEGPVVGLTTRGGRFTACRVSQVVGAYLRSAGVDASAHQLRHLYATRLYAATGDVLVTQQALGHVSVATTAIYARIDPARAREAAANLDRDVG